MAMSPLAQATAFTNKAPVPIAHIVRVFAVLAFIPLFVILQRSLDHRVDRQAITIQELAQLPRGEYLKPALLGYHQLGADIIWLQMLQVLGKRKNSADEYSWLYHALDVITTLDPHYVYAYYVGGVVLSDSGEHVALSNQLLQKGHIANPGEWELLFLLGYNHYFVLGNTAAGAEYIGRASQIPGAPGFLPGLATRMYAESGNPNVALEFLEELWRRNPDLAVREKLEVRAREVMIERDIQELESAVRRYRDQRGRLPKELYDLISNGNLRQIPQEPFGGTYDLDVATGKVSSSTHPNRLKVFRLDKQGRM